MINRFFACIFLLFFALSSQAQIQKGSFGLSANLTGLHNINPTILPFDPSPQTFIQIPYFDYYLTKNIAIGGSGGYARNLQTINQFNKPPTIIKTSQHFFNPHLKYAINWQKANFFLSISAIYAKQVSQQADLSYKEWGSQVGAGFQFFLTKQIAWETWLQVPFLLQKDPVTAVDMSYFSGLKFYLNHAAITPDSMDLYDYYLDKYNIRFGLNLQGLQQYGQEGALFNKFDLVYENFLKDYFLFYLNMSFYNNNGQPLRELRDKNYHFQFGFTMYFPLKESYYFVGELGVLSTNAGYGFHEKITNALGFQLGGSFQYFAPKISVYKLGTILRNTYGSGLRETHLTLVPFAGWEIFVNKNISIEPRLNYIYRQSEKELLSNNRFIFEQKQDSSWLFELKLRTLIYRTRGIIN